jgi:Viral BACON domain
MNLLPGQTIYASGASSYLFGSNMSPDYNTHNARNTPQIQQLIKSAGITLMRCAINAGSADSYIDQTASACQAMNCAMLVILSYRAGSAWNQQLVSRLGSKCLLYEFSNEPDIASPAIKSSDYLAAWKQQIPILRKLNPQAAFIGPALGVYANVGSYLVPWLQGCVSSGIMPDGISFHNYPCTATPDSATCATKSDRLGVSATKLDAVVTGVVGHSLPLCLTEWHINANPGSEPYMTDANFIAKWTKESIDGMVAAGVSMACQFDAGSGAAGGKLDLISTSNYQPQPMYNALKERIQHYLSVAPTVALTTSPTSLSFSGMAGGSALSPQLVTLTNTGNAAAAYSVSAPSWVNVAPSTGTIGASASIGSLISVDLAGLVPGDYSGVITYTAGTASVSVAITLTVQVAPGSRQSVVGPFLVTIAPTAFPHGLGDVPDIVITGIATIGNSTVPTAHTCYVDFTTLNKDTVTLQSDIDGLTVYILAIKQ